MLTIEQPSLLQFRKYLPFVAIFTFIAIALFTQSLIFNNLQGTFSGLTQIFIAHILVYNLYAVLIPFFIYLSKRYPLQARKFIPHFTVHLSTSLLSAAFHLLIAQVIYHLLWEMAEETFYGKLTILFQRWFYVEVLVYWIIVVATNSKKLFEREDLAPKAIGKLGVKHQGQTVLLNFNELNWLQAYDAYVKVYTDDRIYLKRCKISDIEKQLPSNQFTRIHRSAIVNLSKIKALEPYSNGEQFIILETDEKLKLSRSYKGKLSQLNPA